MFFIRLKISKYLFVSCSGGVSFTILSNLEFNNVAVFDDDYLKQYVYQKTDLLKNTFEVMIYSDEYTEYDWFGSDYGILNLKFRKDDGTFDYALIEDINAKSDNGSEMIMSKVVGSQDWYGLMSTYSNRSWNCIDWYVGMDFRYYKSLHKNTISDLFGGEYYIDPARNGVDIQNNPQATDAWKQQHLKVGDAVYRDYDSHIMQEGIFGQAEYSRGKINAFISGSLNYSNYWRYDRLYNTGTNAQSKKIGFWGGHFKTGINYTINPTHNIYLNLGFNSKIPQFKSGAFMSVNTSNVINKKAKNEKSATIEGGYSYNNNYYSLITQNG